MKNNIIYLAISVTFGCLWLGAVAHSETLPIISKSSGAGHMVPQYATGETCLVFADHVEITRRLGSAKITETRTISGGESLYSLISLAKTEDLKTKDNNFCDGPSTSIIANLSGQSEETDGVLLYSTGGCGSAKKYREGPATQMLTRFVSNYCAVQY